MQAANMTVTQGTGPVAPPLTRATKKVIDWLTGGGGEISEAVKLVEPAEPVALRRHRSDHPSDGSGRERGCRSPRDTERTGDASRAAP